MVARAVDTEVEAPVVLLRRGSVGDDVADVQSLLNGIGMVPELDVDGRFGPHTDAAVRFFQKAHRLIVDGVVGRETRAMLDRETVLHGDAGQAASRLGGPCHTPEDPGPDEVRIESPGPSPERPSPASPALLGFALTDAAPDAGGGGGGATQQAQPSDLVVQLTSDEYSDGAAKAYAGNTTPVKVRSPSELKAELAKRRNIGKLIIISHSTSTGEIRFDIGTSLITKSLSDLSSEIRGAANVQQISFLGCNVGVDKAGLDDVKGALNATSAEGSNCHHQVRKVDNPTLSGVVIRTQADFDKLTDVQKRSFDAALREGARNNRGNCLIGTRPGQKLDDISADQLRTMSFRNGGFLVSEFTQEDGTCWKDLKYGGKATCRLEQAK